MAYLDQVQLDRRRSSGGRRGSSPTTSSRRRRSPSSGCSASTRRIQPVRARDHARHATCARGSSRARPTLSGRLRARLSPASPSCTPRARLRRRGAGQPRRPGPHRLGRLGGRQHVPRRRAGDRRRPGLAVPAGQGRAGEWQTVIEDMGIPAGKPKTIVVDLTGKFLSASREVRIVTNLCVYWDEIFLPRARRAAGGADADRSRSRPTCASAASRRR